MPEVGDTAAVAPTLGTAAVGDIVSIAIGPEKVLFKVHKTVICHHSEYFQTAYNGRWKESEDGVTLEDVEVEVFNIFVHWLYKQQLPNSHEGILRIAQANPSQLGNVGNLFDRSSMLLLKACVFGDRFLVPEFERATHNFFIDISSWYVIPYDQIIFAFETFPKDSLILAFMVESQCVCWSADSDEPEEVELRYQLPNEFLVRVMLRYDNLMGQLTKVEDLEPCMYHLHASEKERKKCQDAVGK